MIFDDARGQAPRALEPSAFAQSRTRGRTSFFDPGSDNPAEPDVPHRVCKLALGVLSACSPHSRGLQAVENSPGG